MQLSIAQSGWYEGLKPNPRITVSDWADEKRVLNKRSSSEDGQWRTSRTPFLRDPMNDLSEHSPVREVTFMKGVQIGGTEAGNNWIGYIIDQAPGPFMVIQPTVDMGKRWSRQRLAPMIEDMDCLNTKIKPARARDSGNTTLSKEFDGGLGIITGANSGSGLRSMPTKYLMKDELDAWPVNVDGEGDPSEIVDARTTTYTRSKILNISTPTEMETSRIYKKYKEGDQRKYHVPCPHCEEKQVLDFEKLHWDKDEHGEHMPETVVMLCENCGKDIPEHHKTWMLDQGEWIPTGPANDLHHSYHLPSFYSPLGWMSWVDIVKKFISSKKSRSLLQVFTNLIEGMPFEDETNKVDRHAIQERAEDYRLGELQWGDLVLTAGTDTQPDRFETIVLAHTMTSIRVVDYKIIHGDPDDKATRQELDDYLRAPWQHPSGKQLVIQGGGVDSGGHNTQTIYDFCRKLKRRHIIAVKGHSQRWKQIIGKPSKVDVSIKGKAITNGAELWMVGTDTAKLQIYNRLGVTDPDADGYIHFSKDLPTEFYEQLTVEKLSTHYVNGYPVRTWSKPASARNEVIDCFVYALAAFYHLGINRWRPAQWRQLEEKIQPKTPDLFAVPENIDQETPAEEENMPVKTKKPRARRRKPSRSGFVLGGGMYGW
jgi:phage terminase large subunit GpA-like protein